jgi:hypothetical protein
MTFRGTIVSMFEVIGAIGACLLLFSFYRTSVGKWTGKSIWFEVDNLLAAACMVTYAIHKKAYISIVLNIIWASVAIRGLTSIAERRRKSK